MHFNETEKYFLTYEEKVYSNKRRENCEGECTTIKLELIEFHPKNIVRELINENIFEKICTMSSISKDCQVMNYNQLVNTFVEDYQKAEYTHAELNISTSVSFQNANIINIRMNTSEYFGEVHGNYNMFSLFFNPKTGQEISVENIFTDREGFRQIAEDFFINPHIGRGNMYLGQENMNSHGFWFEDDIFDISENIIITPDIVTLFYNPYEIASYTNDTLRVEIPMREVRRFIKW